MIEMRGRKKQIIHSSHVACLPCLIFSLVLLGSTQFVWSVDVDEYAKTGNPAAIPLVTSTIYNQISNLTKLFQKDIKNALGFCIKDVDADLNGAFKYSNNLDFLSNCVKENTDLSQRLCTAAEMKFYFSTFMDSKSADAQFLKPNNNCNLDSWVPGCEPGWASSVAPSAKVDLKNAKDIPDRALESQPCCEGFFCPRGLTCMIPCPLGSFCPRAKLNKATGLCDPYVYRLPHGKPNHTCGGADMWASVGTSEEIFCAAGSYCPTNIKKIQCTSGNYCRMGSISQRACFKLSTCNRNTDKQNLHAVGLLLIGALSFILIIIYNCSDQVLTTRYERMAKSREKAARSARETAQARQRWKVAKDNVAKKRAVGLQQQLSRTFSRKTSARGAADVEDTLSQSSTSNPQAPTTTNLPLPPSAAAKSKKKESELTKMMNSIDDDPDNHEGFHFKIGDKNMKKQTPKNPKLNSRSQIFRYAYGQLEKEKAMEQKNKNLTFSGVISMATDSDIQKRPTIEVAFKDLTITLKKKNIHLMRSVTGKIMPGRISAVMGPSGAGKTTFLSAVMGKITGCHVTGSVLINGKHEPIQSYRKIIGFVPQDDIVHGNLTVEENLRFHARCRLSVDLPKADKVLIVERVIESLGLQPVRESLVGTVERRGISGGQRKRVNVGLEMVMEPSLLILDEPTSGLDSSSSNLLLKALRREALEGVNISMVVHQPSYALYKMFDDLILLAKGGLIVYHGPVKKVEEYFAGVGITIPERVNPPDHLIDILEGIVKPSANVKPQQLPVRWMLYNGYAVPSDMLECLDEAGASAKPPEQNISADISQDKQDQPTSQLLDFSERGTPGIIRQYRYYMGRVIKQRMREAKVQAVDYLILLVAGACLGTLSQVKGDTFGYHGFMYTVIAVSLLCKIAALRSFSLDKLHYWRESGSGMSSLACFLAKDTVDNFNSLIKPLVFLSMFFFFNNPRSTFQENYFILFCLIYCVTGIAYIFAICLDPGPAQLWCVLLPVVLTLIANQGPNDKIGKFLSNYCYPKWALEAFVIANAQRFSGVWLISRCGTMMEYGYNVNTFFRCLGFLLITGIASRLVAFICLITVAKR